MILRPSRLKIDRADKHISDIKRCLVRLEDSETSVIEVNPTTGSERLKHDFSDRAALTDIALTLGDAIHNLKCALDYAWLQTIARVVPSAVGKFAKFPVYRHADQLKSALEGREIHLSAPRLFGLVMTDINPCEGGNPAIWSVHKLDIRDKHRLLIPVFTNLSIVGIDVEDENGERFPGGNTWATTKEPPYCIDLAPGLHFKNKGVLSYEVIFEDVESGYLMHVPGTILHYSKIILRVVETFERFLESEKSF